MLLGYSVVSTFTAINFATIEWQQSGLFNCWLRGAFLEQTERRADIDDIKRHHNHVFRRLQVLSNIGRIQVSNALRDDMRLLLEIIKAEAKLEPKELDVSMSSDEAIDFLCSTYGVR